MGKAYPFLRKRFYKDAPIIYPDNATFYYPSFRLLSSIRTINSRSLYASLIHLTVTIVVFDPELGTMWSVGYMDTHDNTLWVF